MKNINIFKVYIIFLFLLSSYYLSAVYLSTVNNAMSEWVINYGGGFVRRGLIGELIFQISSISNLNLRDFFIIFQILSYFFYYALIYWLLKDLKKNFLISLAIFSPVFYSFGLYELEALGRKEILMYVFFSYNFYLFYKYKNINLNYLYSYISLPILILSHEAVIFYFLFYLFFFFVVDKKKNWRFFLLSGILIFIVIFLSLALFINPHSNFDNLKMCKRLLEISNEYCGLGASFTTADISRHINEVDWKLIDIVNYILIFIFGFTAIFFLIYKSELVSNIIYIKKSIFISIIFCSLPPMLLFLIAVDSGRWTSMLFHMIAITYFGLIKLELIKVDKNFRFKFFDFEQSKRKLIPYMVLFFLCFGWSPKAVYHESFGSFPAYRMIAKAYKFLPNYKHPDHLFKRIFLNN